MRCMDFMDAPFRIISHLTNSACHTGCVSNGYEMMRMRDPVFKSMNRTLAHVTRLLSEYITLNEDRQRHPESHRPSLSTQLWNERLSSCSLKRQVYYRNWTKVNLMAYEWWRTCPWFVKQCRNGCSYQIMNPGRWVKQVHICG